MKTTITICTGTEEKKITRKTAAEMVGEERFKRMLAEAKEGFVEDPFTEQSYHIGGNKMMVFEFSA